MRKYSDNCTSILIGKKASIDGSTIIARNEDYFTPYNPKTFLVRPANDKKDRVYTSPTTGVMIPLPTHAYRYTCCPSTYDPEVNPAIAKDNPFYEEAGVNEKNVAMSATESAFTNARFKGFDPLVKHGVNEDSMVTVVLPYIDSAKAGVKRLGKLIEKFGTGQSNGISFADKDNIWYFESIGGHQWVAERIPDDCYALAPNQINIQNVDFKDHKNFMWSSHLKKFVKKHHLNPEPGTFNLRKIAGTHGNLDRHYNTPRAWYGVKLFSPKIAEKLTPTSGNIPFILHANRKLTVEDAEYYLASHYQNTKYDPTNLKKPVFRPIGIDRGQESHIIQIRNNVPADYSVVEWLAMGLFAYSPYVPFFTNILKTPANYQIADQNHYTMKSAFWMYKTLAALVNQNYKKYADMINTYKEKCQEYANHRVHWTDEKAKDLQPEQL